MGYRELPLTVSPRRIVISGETYDVDESMALPLPFDCVSLRNPERTRELVFAIESQAFVAQWTADGQRDLEMEFSLHAHGAAAGHLRWSHRDAWVIEPRGGPRRVLQRDDHLRFGRR